MESFDETFDTDNDIFTWMYRLSHGWSGINGYLPSYRSDMRRKDINGETTADPLTAFKLLFCVTARELAKSIKVEIQDLGTLFVEVMQAGTVGSKKTWVALKMNKKRLPRRDSLDRAPESGSNNPQFGQGQMLWLVRRVANREINRLHAVGYRFTNVSKIAEGLSDALEVNKDDLTLSLGKMYSATTRQKTYEGVHVVCFALRPVWQRSFDVLAQKDHRNLLPSIKLSLPKLDASHLEYLQELDGKTVGYCLSILPSQPTFKNADEEAFAAEFLASVHHLAANIGKKWFLNAKLIANPFVVSGCRTASHPEVEFATLISFRVMANTHDYTNFNNLYQYIPRKFFMASQGGYRSSWEKGLLARHTSGIAGSVDHLPIPTSIASFNQCSDHLHNSNKALPNKFSCPLSSSGRFLFTGPRNHKQQLDDGSSQKDLVPSQAGWRQQTRPTNSDSTFDMDVIEVQNNRAYRHGFEVTTMDPEMIMEKLLTITITERRPVDPDDSEAWP